MIVLPPGLPTIKIGLPFLDTIVGVMDESIRFCGSIWFGCVPNCPFWSINPGMQNRPFRY